MSSENYPEGRSTPYFLNNSRASVIIFTGASTGDEVARLEQPGTVNGCKWLLWDKTLEVGKYVIELCDCLDVVVLVLLLLYILPQVSTLGVPNNGWRFYYSFFSSGGSCLDLAQSRMTAPHELVSTNIDTLHRLSENMKL